MTYIELLQTTEWKEKRKKILTRDRWECQECFNESIISNLNVGLFPSKNKRIYDTTNRVLIESIDRRFGGMVGEFIVPFLSLDLVAYFNEENGYLNIVGLRNFSIEELKLIKLQNDTIEKNAYKEFQFSFIDKNDRERALNDFVINRDNILKQLSIRSIESYKWVFTRLDIHHKYYQDDCLPWEYPDDALIALCRSCHENHHTNKEIIHKDEFGKTIGKLNPCPRCSGLGYLPEYNHVENGICFHCYGDRFIEFINKTNE